MKKFFSLLLISFLFSNCSTSKKQSFLVGTYTDEVGQGINYIDFDLRTNKIVLNSVISDIKNPSFVISNKAKTVIFAVEELQSAMGGKLTSFAFDTRTKQFQKINSVDTFGNHPCYVALSPDESYLVVGNYSSGNYTVYPLDKYGRLGDKFQLIQHKGSSINSNRQESPHVHSVVFHPADNKLFIADLGNDTIEIVPFNVTNDLFLAIENASVFSVKAGSGPRHIIFDATGKNLYVVFELTNEIAIASYKNNKLQILQTVLLTDIPTKNGSAAEIKISKDENYIYTSVRGADNLLVVLQKQEDESWKKIQQISTGITPRNFILTKNEEKILVANQDSNSIMVFDRNKKTGLLTKTPEEFLIHKPVYFWSF